MTNLKIAALSAFAAIGLTSAAVAQPSAERAPQIELPADQKGMQGEMGGMMEMMKDPEMREQMKEMMRNCSRMMQMKQENMMQMEQGKTPAN